MTTTDETGDPAPSDPAAPDRRDVRVTYWIVDKVTGDRQTNTAELVQTDWYKPNPADPENDYLDADPLDPDAACIDLDSRMSLDITTGPKLSPGEHVRVTLEVLREATDA